jgi:hypothetical protein
MKKALFLFVAVIVNFVPVVAQSPSPLKFAETRWDFGTIGEDGGPVSHIFTFTNGGATPISIDRANSSCGCTTPEYPKRPLAPGGTGKITVTFDPRGYPGDFTKTVGVVSGGGKHVDFLTITGRVAPRPRSIEDEFPHDMGGGARLDNTTVAFGQIPQGRLVSAEVKYVNTSSRPVSLAIAPVESSGLLVVEAPETICAGCRGGILLSYDLSAAKTGEGRTGYGMHHDVLRVTVDGATSTQTVYTAMTGIDNFKGVDTDTAPRFFLDAQSHDFGEVRRRIVPYVHRLTASNEGETELHIRSVSFSDGLRCTLTAGMTIAPHAELPFELTLYSENYRRGELRESIIIVVDDPLRPVREIRISAKLK